VKIRVRSSSPLRKKSKHGFRGYPVATVAFYGPTDELTTKVAVGIVLAEGEEPAHLERWFSKEEDIRQDEEVEAGVLRFITGHAVRSVVITDGIIGCPHEEGIDYPEGTSCPECPYWAGRDRFDKERIR
jgi:hypothetical protein